MEPIFGGSENKGPIQSIQHLDVPGYTLSDIFFRRLLQPLKKQLMNTEISDQAIGQFALGMMAVAIAVLILWIGFRFGVSLKA